jgi:hypothetical protein
MISCPTNYRESLRVATCRRETVEWLQYIIDLYPDLQNVAQQALSQANQVGGRLNRFIRAVETKHNEFES